MVNTGWFSIMAGPLRFERAGIDQSDAQQKGPDPTIRTGPWLSSNEFLAVALIQDRAHGVTGRLADTFAVGAGVAPQVRDAGIQLVAKLTGRVAHPRPQFQEILIARQVQVRKADRA